MTGIISWTAHAYYTFHPKHSKANDPVDRTRSGMMTIFRYPRPDILWYPAEMKEEPYLYIKDAWKAGIKQLTIFSNGEEVELRLNGRFLDKKGPSQDSAYYGLDHPPFVFEIDQYEAGKLLATAISDGKVIAERQIQTPGSPTSIRLEVDTLGRDFVADGSDILLAYAHVIDKNGTTLEDASYVVQFEVEGNASIVGEGADIGANPMFTEYGVAPVLIKAGTQAGKIRLKAKAKGLNAAEASFYSIPYSAPLAKPIYDFESVRVDLGAQDQLLQFDWTAWNGEDNQPSECSFEEMGAFRARIESASPIGILRWLGEMNVIGKYGYVYGDGVLGIDEAGISLSFFDLPAGSYKLTTWHHAPRSNTDSMDPNRDKLKNLKIPSIPFEGKLWVSVNNQESSVLVTEGKSMQFEEASTHSLIFQSDGKSPVKIHFKGETDKGIWLNGFELSQWDF